MIDKKYIKLINYEIDGIITPRQKSILDNYLKNNHQAEKLYREMITTCKIIDEIPEIEPSDNLKKRIMNSINFNRYSEKSKIKWIAYHNMEWIFNPKSKMAIAFILGMFVAFLFLTPFWLNDVEEKITSDTNFYGTIVWDRITDLKPFKQININLSFIQGAIDIKQLDQLFIFELDINSNDQTELIFEYDPNYIQLMYIKPGISNQKIEIDKYSVKVTDVKKISSFLFFAPITESPTGIIMKVYQTGSLQLQQTIALDSALVVE